MDHYYEKQFLRNEANDYALIVHHIHESENGFTGIVKLQRRNGNPELPFITKYVYHGAVYDTLEDAVKHYEETGKVKRRLWGRKPL